MHGKNKQKSTMEVNEGEGGETRWGRQGENSCFSTFDNACQTQLK